MKYNKTYDTFESQEKDSSNYILRFMYLQDIGRRYLINIFLTMIPIEQESGNSVLIDIQGIPEIFSVVISPLLVEDKVVLPNSDGDMDNDVEDKLSEDSQLAAVLRKWDDMSLMWSLDAELRLQSSSLEIVGSCNFSIFLILLFDKRPVLLSSVRL